MTAHEFLNRLELTFNKRYAVEQADIYLGKLKPLKFERLESIYDRLVERHTKTTLPNLADMLAISKQIALEATGGRESSKIHEWTETPCQLCHGEGRISVFRRLQSDGILTTAAVKQYSGKNRVMERIDGDAPIYEFLYRCSCEAGRAAYLEGLPVYIQT